ncbi:MAG: phosphatase PAP2 family protein [Planctomycetaceae bacterium]|nr:phosphatase PAP2 family protein [Planctomycetaceae bacterium]
MSFLNLWLSDLTNGQRKASFISTSNTPAVSHAYSMMGVIAPIILFCLAWLLAPYDVLISWHCYKVHAGKETALKNLLNQTEPFGHGVGVVLAGAVIFSMEDKQRKTGFSLLTSGIGAGLLADLMKLFVARCRPRDFDFASFSGMGTFLEWLPGFGQGSCSQSFPSAHSATAMGMAIMLSTIYPRGRWLFAFLAWLVMGHRLHLGAHYLSDILVGAGIGWLFAVWCVRLAVRFRYLVLEDSLEQPRNNEL